MVFESDFDLLYFFENPTLNNKKITARIFKKYGFTDENKIQKIADVTIYPPEYFCPKNYETGEINITENTYSIHHYDPSWITNNHKWYDVDFPDVIAERRKYYSEDECYKMIDGDARESGWLTNIPYNKHAILVLEGISMYLTNSELKKLISNIGNHFENVNLLMDCYLFVIL